MVLIWLAGAVRAGAQSSSPPLLMDFMEQGMNADEILLAECLQGLMNRQGPKVYYTTVDSFAPNPYISYVWLSYLTNELGYSFTNASNFRDLIQRARNAGVIAGLVRYSSTNIGGAEVQTAMTLAAQRNALPVTDQILAYQTPGLKNKGTIACFDALPVLQDIRGQWTSSLDARQWQVDNLLTNSSRNELFCDGGHWFGPVSGSTGCCESGFCGRDYAVELNAFSFDFPMSQTAYSTLFNTVMAWPAQPAPVFGVWPGYGGGENEGSSTPRISKAGNYWVLTHMALNTSFLAVVPVARSNVYLRKASSHLTLDNSKYYILFQTSEGDTIKQAWQMPGTAAWNDPSRGQVPIAWGVNPSLADRLPVYLQFLKTHAGAKDTFFAGPNGAGYNWLKFMNPAGQAAMGAASEPYLEATGLQLVDVWGLTTDSLNNYKANAPAVQSFTGEIGPANTLLSTGTPLSRCDSTLWYGGQNMTNYPQDIVQRIQNVAASNPPPYFIIVYDTVDHCMDFAKICAANLGQQYVIVGAEDYLDLANQRWFPSSATSQFLPNPGWDPTTSGTDGGRNWTYTYASSGDRAYEFNDIYNAGRIPVHDGSRGFLKVQVSGSLGNEFEYAASPWFSTAPNATWQAAVYARPEFDNVNQGQAAWVKVSNSAPSVITFPSALNEDLSFYFPAGATNVQSFSGKLTGLGTSSVNAFGPNLNGAAGTVSAVVPPLAIAKDGQTVTCTWPGGLSSWHLWTTTNLQPAANWSMVVDGVTESGGSSKAVIPVEQNKQFFQLRYP